MIESLKKQLKAIDLCLAACRRRQSPRTRFLHHFWGHSEATDTIPLYENFCFVLALYRQRTVESCLEGKDLLERLLGFQAPDGSFPVYLHEFPRSSDWMQGLKVAPLLLQLQRHFGSILSPDLKVKMTEAIAKMLDFVKDRVSPSWQFRYRMCLEGGPLQNPDPAQFSPADWTEWLISAQLGDPGSIGLSELFHSRLQAFVGPAHTDIQEGFEPRPSPIEWLLAEREEHFTERLLRDHPLQIHLAALWPLEGVNKPQILSLSEFFFRGPNWALSLQINERKSANLLRVLWEGKRLHSLVLPELKAKASIAHSPVDGEPIEILFDLPEEADQTRNDLFEIALFCDASPDMDLTIGGKKGTTFFLGDRIEIASPKGTLGIRFESVSGTGDFRGHLSRANRPSQTSVKNFEAYDWQIGLRTLRRSPKAQIRVILDVNFPSENPHREKILPQIR